MQINKFFAILNLILLENKTNSNEISCVNLCFNNESYIKFQLKDIEYLEDYLQDLQKQTKNLQKQTSSDTSIIEAGIVTGISLLAAILSI
jgi:hypothetical protein